MVCVMCVLGSTNNLMLLKCHAIIDLTNAGLYK